MSDFDPALPRDGVFVGRVLAPEKAHPLVVTVRDGTLFDITAKAGPTVRDIAELPDPAAYVRTASGRPIGALADIAANNVAAGRDPGKPFLLAPVDL